MPEGAALLCNLGVSSVERGACFKLWRAALCTRPKIWVGRARAGASPVVNGKVSAAGRVPSRHEPAR